MAPLSTRRHVTIRGDANPYDPANANYFAERCARQDDLAPAVPPAWLAL
jgi:RNA-directed DNA polymerase